MVTPASRILGQLLVERGDVTADELGRALKEQTRHPRRLGGILLEMGALEPEALARGLADQLGLPYEPPPLEPQPPAVRLVDPDLARRRRLLPLSVEGRRLRVAMVDPLDLEAADDVRFQCGRRVDPVVASPAAVEAGLGRAYGGRLSALIEALPHGPDGGRAAGEEADEGRLVQEARAGPVVRLVDHVLARAVEEGASDVHVERQGPDVRVRFRVDGVLREALELPAASRRAVLSRIKIMAGMDISVRRRPQDGGLRLRHGARTLTCRVSTLPTVDGEKAVLRILDPRRAPTDLGGLGMSPGDLARVRSVVAAGRGVLLASGPTGSGKSSTLHAALKEVDRSRRNVVSLEDPVEYRMAGVNQVQVHPRAGLTFPSALRSVLRQDPDVVMVGEIRDRETAEIAMAAAVTGHLVLSTLHTTDAPGAVTRLLDMGVPPFLVAGGLAGVVAQRLVRTLCARCRGRSSRGCPDCVEGYAGRTGVFQVLVMTEAVREEVTGRADTDALHRLGREAGMGTLADDARRKVAEGVTSPHEVARILRGDPAAALPCTACASPVPVGASGCPACGAGRVRACACGRALRRGWRFCPWCLRRIPSRSNSPTWGP
jgi:type IV pilus assembly protein PilB